MNSVVLRITETAEEYISNTSIEGCVCCLLVEREEEKRGAALICGWRIPKKRYPVN